MIRNNRDYSWVDWRSWRKFTTLLILSRQKTILWPQHLNLKERRQKTNGRLKLIDYIMKGSSDLNYDKDSKEDKSYLLSNFLKINLICTCISLNYKIFDTSNKVNLAWHYKIKNCHNYLNFKFDFWLEWNKK